MSEVNRNLSSPMNQINRYWSSEIEMTDFNLIMNIGNIIVFLGTLLLIKDVLKNRNTLKGYSILGSLLTFIAISLFQAGFFMMGVWTWTIGTVTAFYWLIAFLFVFREKFRGWRDRRKGEQAVYKMLGVKNKKEAMKLRNQVFGINHSCPCSECREIRKILNDFNRDVTL